jgi:hypothetical protein
MNIETKTKFIVICSVCLACLILCGCYEEQSNNKTQYSVSTQKIIDGKDKQEEIEGYSPVVQDALDYVHEHSTERMKKYISRGKLVIGMNQKEVVACLHTTNFRDGVPVTSNTYNSKYGKYETWIIGGSSGGNYSSYSHPRYALDFTHYILACIHKSKVLRVDDNLHLARAD